MKNKKIDSLVLNAEMKSGKQTEQEIQHKQF